MSITRAQVRHAPAKQRSVFYAVDWLNTAISLLRKERDKSAPDTDTMAMAWKQSVVALSHLARQLQASDIRPSASVMDRGERDVLEFFQREKIGDVR